MGFYREPFQQEEGIQASWESYASMPIIYNSYIKVDGSVIDINNPNSPYSCLERRRLYHIAQLYSNYNKFKYMGTNAIINAAPCMGPGKGWDKTT